MCKSVARACIWQRGLHTLVHLPGKAHGLVSACVCERGCENDDSRLHTYRHALMPTRKCVFLSTKK
eukprot:1918047-Pleurochrysis_carterae.AAC.1